MRGKLIVIEGMDGAGTTTQSQLLKERLEAMGRRVHLTREPTQSAIGKTIRAYLSEGVEGTQVKPILALLFAADRLAHLDDEIEPMLSKGIDVISDRYLMSSLVYQGLDLPGQWVSVINQYALQPHLTVLVDLPLKIAHERRKLRGGAAEIFEKESLQAQIRERYLHFANQKGVALVDGDASPDIVCQRIVDVVRPEL